MTESIAILDFGSQYAQIIARRVREANVYCELFPWDAPQEKILSINPKGFILSGGPKSAIYPKIYFGVRPAHSWDLLWNAGINSCAWR